MNKLVRKGISMAAVLFLMVFMFSGLAFADNSTNGLVAHYTFDGDFKDATGSGMDGTAVGDVSFASDGVNGQCAVFNNGYLNVTNGSAIDPGKQFTIAAWIKLDAAAADNNSNPIVYKFLPTYSNSHQETFSAIAGGTNCLELLQHSIRPDNSTNVSSAQAEDLVLAEGWTHVAFAADGNTEYIYVNGKLSGSAQIDADTQDGSFNSDGDFFIGKDDGNHMLLGKMDDLRIYNRVLSGDEIKALANTGATSHKIVLQLLNTKMYVDGKEVPVDSNSSIYPYTENGRTMVPIRAVVEAMGGTINWDGGNFEADISLNSKTIKLWLNNQNAYVNGQPITLDVPATEVEGRIMIPLKFVAENLGAKVDWDGNTEQITVSY